MKTRIFNLTIFLCVLTLFGCKDDNPEIIQNESVIIYQSTVSEDILKFLSPDLESGLSVPRNTFSYENDILEKILSEHPDATEEEISITDVRVLSVKVIFDTTGFPLDPIVEIDKGNLSMRRFLENTVVDIPLAELDFANSNSLELNFTPEDLMLNNIIDDIADSMIFFFTIKVDLSGMTLWADYDVSLSYQYEIVKED